MSIGKNTVSGEQLRGFVERVERLRAEKKTISQDEAAVMAEAKAAGFVPAIIRGVLKARSQKPHDRQETEALFDMYMHSLGMGDEPPLFRALNAASADPTSRDAIIEGLKTFAPSEGDIVVRMGGQPVRMWRDKDGVAQIEDYAEPAARAPGHAAAPAPQAPRQEVPEVPEVDADGAEVLGREAAKANRPVIDNPFPFGDERRARFDAGWRAENGGDGMGED